MRHGLVNGRLADGRVIDLVVDGGRIEMVAPHGSVDLGELERTDLGGWLLLPAMGEPHAHLDKALTADMVPNPTGDLPGAIDAWVAAAEQGVFTHDDMVRRVRMALEKLLLSGVTAVRSHVNTGERTGTDHLLAVQEAAADFRDLMHIELVALVHTPMTGEGSDGNVRSLYDCADAGVDLMGGCPHLELDGPGAIDVALRAAADTGTRVDLHVDETLDPAVLTLRDVARRVIDSRFGASVTASHCVSLGMQSPDVQAEVAALVADAGISIVTLPQTNLFLQGRDRPTATPRGLTAIGPLLDAGALVCAGADNVQDPFNLVGRSDPLETAALLVMAGHLAPEQAFDLVSNNVRRTLGLDPVTFAPGSPADFVAIDTTTVRAAIADAPADRLVVHDGRVVASTVTKRAVHARERVAPAPTPYDRGV